MSTRTSEFVSRYTARYSSPSGRSPETRAAPPAAEQRTVQQRGARAPKARVTNGSPIPTGLTDSHPKFDTPGTLVDRVAAHLREMILNGTMSPGTRLNELQLAREFSLSRSPLREAFRMLAAEGLLSITPRRGAWVRPISIDELRDVFEMRELFELFALTHAHQKDVSELAHMRTLLRHAEVMLKRGDVEAWYESSQSFHDAIVDAAGNRQLSALYKLLKLAMRRYQLMVIGLPRHPDGSQAEHQQVFAALARGDTQRACDLLRDHLHRVTETLAAALKKGRTKAELQGRARHLQRAVAARATGRARKGR